MGLHNRGNLHTKHIYTLILTLKSNAKNFFLKYVYNNKIKSSRQLPLNVLLSEQNPATHC